MGGTIKNGGKGRGSRNLNHGGAAGHGGNPGWMRGQEKRCSRKGAKEEERATLTSCDERSEVVRVRGNFPGEASSLKPANLFLSLLHSFVEPEVPMVQSPGFFWIFEPRRNEVTKERRNEEEGRKGTTSGSRAL